MIKNIPNAAPLQSCMKGVELGIQLQCLLRVAL